MAFKLADGNPTDTSAENPIDNFGSFQEPVIWRSRKHRDETNPGQAAGTFKPKPTFVGYLAGPTGVTSLGSRYRSYFAVSGYGSQIWRSDPNYDNAAGGIEVYIPKLDSSTGSIKAFFKNSAARITPGGTGSGAGRFVVAGQGLVVSHNPRLSDSSTGEVRIQRIGPVENREESYYSHYNYNSKFDSQSVNWLSFTLGKNTDSTVFDTHNSQTDIPQLHNDLQIVKTGLNSAYSSEKRYAVGCDRVVIAEPRSTQFSSTKKGYVCIYDLSGTNCIAELSHPDQNVTGISGEFGGVVCIADGFIFVADYLWQSSQNSGSTWTATPGKAIGKVWMYDLNGNLVREISPRYMTGTGRTNSSKTRVNLYAESDTESGWDNYPFQSIYLPNYDMYFGASLAAGGGKLVVGVPGYSTDATGYSTGYNPNMESSTDSNNHGLALVFDYGDDIKAKRPDEFDKAGGYDYGWDNNSVGAQMRPVAWSHPTWYLEKAFHGGTSPNAYTGGRLGYSVAISSQYILCGAPYSHGDGTVYIFDHDMTYLGKWTNPTDDMNSELSQNWTKSGSRFGSSVEAQGNTIVAGTYWGWAAVYTHSQYINIYDAISLQNGWF